jgi:peptidylprolyl isomerase
VTPVSASLSLPRALVPKARPSLTRARADFTLGNGRGGDSAFGGPFEDEGFPFKHDGRFKLSMANAGRNTNGSQFFVTFAACDWLDGKHVVFGEVAEGHEVVAKVEALGSASGRPTAKIVIADCGVVGDKSAAL